MKRTMTGTLAALLPFLLLAGLGCEQVVRSFAAQLSGSWIVPPVTTAATGEAILNLDAGDTEVGYKLTVEDIENVASAYIYLAPAGQTGEIIADLYPGPTKPGPFSGVLAENSLRVADLKGPLAGEPMSRMIAVLRAGSTYVQVNTDSFPNGEIRGQIR